MGDELVKAVLEDHTTAEIDEDLRAMLDFVAKLTLRPEDVDGEDIAVLHDAGLDDEAIADAVGIAIAFNMVDRLSDSLGWQVPPAAIFKRMSKILLARGYS